MGIHAFLKSAFEVALIGAFIFSLGYLVLTAFAVALRRLRNHGMTKDGFVATGQARGTDGTVNPWYYEMPEPGYNYRLSDIHAALATSQLRRLDDFVSRRRTLAVQFDVAAGDGSSCLAARLEKAAEEQPAVDAKLVVRHV